LKKVSERRRLLKYLQKENEEQFKDLAIKLKLKIAKKMIEDDEEEKRKLEEVMNDDADEEENEEVEEVKEED
jgi:hypothetical protein